MVLTLLDYWDKVGVPDLFLPLFLSIMRWATRWDVMKRGTAADNAIMLSV